jgi:hypothetical protein
MPEIHTRAMFAENLNTRFQIVDNPEAPLDLVLTRVDEGRTTPTQEMFSILFHGPAHTFVPQGMRKLKHERLGELDLFLVPVGKDNDEFIYEAVFNRMIRSS